MRFVGLHNVQLLYLRSQSVDLLGLLFGFQNCHIVEMLVMVVRPEESKSRKAEGALAPCIHAAFSGAELQPESHAPATLHPFEAHSGHPLLHPYPPAHWQPGGLFCLRAETLIQLSSSGARLERMFSAVSKFRFSAITTSQGIRLLATWSAIVCHRSNSCPLGLLNLVVLGVVCVK